MMKDTDPNPAKPVVVTVSDPVVTGVEPRRTSEDVDTEPFMLRRRSPKEVSDYDSGFQCGSKGGQNDDTQSPAWQRGWAEAQE